MVIIYRIRRISRDTQDLIRTTKLIKKYNENQFTITHFTTGPKRSWYFDRKFKIEICSTHKQKGFYFIPKGLHGGRHLTYTFRFSVPLDPLVNYTLNYNIMRIYCALWVKTLWTSTMFFFSLINNVLMILTPIIRQNNGSGWGSRM